MGYLSPNFLIGSIHIGTIEGASAFNMGNNWPTGFTSFKKQNQGFGSITGDHNDIKEILARLDDSDSMDIFAHPENEEIPEWLQEVILTRISVAQADEDQQPDEG